MNDYNEEIWSNVMKLKNAGKSESNGVANTLTRDDLDTILGTAEFFGCGSEELNFIYFDLWIAKYRLFDWLAMCIQGRLPNKELVKVLTYSFVKVGGVPSAFIDDLRVTDYDIDRKWEKLNI